MIRLVLESLFVDRCVACSASLGGATTFCAQCAPTAFDIESPCCRRCAVPFDADGAVDSLCVDCLTQTRWFSRVEARWEYCGAVSDAIKEGKRAERPQIHRQLAVAAAPWFGALAAEYGDRRWTTVPPRRRDLRRRGFDHVGSLLRALCKASGTRPTVGAPLRKNDETVRQAAASRCGRLAQQRDAFSSVPVDGPWVVFDDVMTTGATMSAAARSLRRAGASDVVAVVLARTPRLGL